MRTSEFLKLRLPERKAVNDAADIEDLTFDMEKLDAEAARQKLTDDNLQRDKVENTAFNKHKVASILDHPDNSVTDAKIGERSIGTSKGMLQALLDTIGNAIKNITGNATWSELPAVTLSATKLHIDSKENPHGTTKAQVGLGNADNTNDINKPVSTAQAAAIKAVQDDVTAHKANAQNPHSTTAEQVGAYTKSVVDAKDKAINDAATAHYGDNDRHINSGERPKWNDKYTKSEVDNKFSMLETNTDWKESVATFADIAKTYPTPQDGWTVNTRDTDYTYRYSGTQWVVISANAIPKATTSVDGLQTKENVADVTANTANRHNHNNLSLLQTITQTLVNNWNAAFTHVSDTVKHISASERADWNSKATGSHNHSGTYEPVFTKNNAFNKNFGTAEGTVCQGNDARLSNARIASDVYAWAKTASKPSYNASEVGALSIGGGTLTGNLILNAAPTANLQAANKKYVDDIASGKGNGDMLKTVYDANNDGIVDNAALLGGLASGEFCRANDSRLSDTRPANGGTSTAAYKIVEADTRSDNQTPTWYMLNHGKTVVYEFKFTNVIGLKSSFSDVPIYGEMSTYTSWGDSSGSRPVQLITCDTGIYFRTSASDTAWNAWQKIWTGTNNGGNANTLDNLDSTAFAKARTITLAELNSTNLTSGIYNIQSVSLSSVGLPGNFAHIFVGGDYSGGCDSQIAIPYQDGAMNGVWYRVANGANFPVFRRIDDYNNLVNKPQSLPASDVYAWAKQSSKPSYNASEVGLGNVNNTADANKSVNYASSAGSIDGGTY